MSPDRPADAPPEQAQLPIDLPEPEVLTEREAFEYMLIAQRMRFDSAMADPTIAMGVREYTAALNERRRKAKAR